MGVAEIVQSKTGQVATGKQPYQFVRKAVRLQRVSVRLSDDERIARSPRPEA